MHAADNALSAASYVLTNFKKGHVPTDRPEAQSLAFFVTIERLITLSTNS